MNPGKLFIVSAPSGAGKTSLVLSALAHLEGQCSIERVITYTSKSPRPGEKHGHDYYFITQEEFLKKIEEGFFIEYSTAYGHYYGTPRSIVDALVTGMSYILVIDRAGAKQIKRQTDQVVLIWIHIENVETLEKRLIGRNTEDKKQLEQRLLLANKELLEEKEEKFYDHHILNDVFENALLELVFVICKSLGLERMAPGTKKK